VGKSELREVERFVRLILIHVIKAASLPEGRAIDHWRGEVEVFRLDLVDNLTPSMRPKLNLDKVWRIACIKAAAELKKEGDAIAAGLPNCNPFALDEITDERFDFDSAAERLRNVN
jgi:hypothetical protein